MKKSLETIFRENLRFYRQRASFSQEKLSSLLDKNINYINMIEGGKSIPPLSMIEKIAEVLQVEPQLFLVERDKSEVFDKNAFIEEASEKIAAHSKEILRSLFN